MQNCTEGHSVEQLPGLSDLINNSSYWDPWDTMFHKTTSDDFLKITNIWQCKLTILSK